MTGRRSKTLDGWRVSGSPSKGWTLHQLGDNGPVRRAWFHHADDLYVFGSSTPGAAVLLLAAWARQVENLARTTGGVS